MINEDEIENLRNFVLHPAWDIYKRLLKSKFDDEYKKLRTAKDMTEISRISGKLDGVEYCLRVIDTQLSEFNANSEKKEDHNQE